MTRLGGVQPNGGRKPLELVLQPRVFACLDYWMHEEKLLTGVEILVANLGGPGTRVRVADSTALARLFGATLALQEVLPEAIEAVNKTWAAVDRETMHAHRVDLERVLSTRQVVTSALKALAVDRVRHNKELSDLGTADGVRSRQRERGPVGCRR